ncbi:IspD/TarI family cytidylyltransferase [Pediococcus pentosaceus]|uniref:IspD/TarI family cytidylyltransferase n=1 Tax=Pediococcus pentosaceus TaxID=1255 RepID=UPI0025B14F72|nr:IspD/TarI family cytidylyltransferase [Pediococcus pentosaceus]MDN3207601.1 IspD/TarI family cytidylyltransferase [Pediococcus pentosaceus]
MKKIGVIFAGGVGSRMRSKGKPKQFLEVGGKPIIVHTVEIFQKAKIIDEIVIVILKDWQDEMNRLVEKFELTKVKKIVPGGKTGQLSIFNGLEAAEELSMDDSDIVLIHDGVRPLINEEVLENNVKNVIEKGSAITTAPAKETVVLVNNEMDVESVVDRNQSYIAKAPQSFYLKDILGTHRLAMKEGITDSIDSSTLMGMYNKKLSIISGPYENIKITTPDDFYMFSALADAKENAQIFGI